MGANGERLLETIRADEHVNQADFFDPGILTFTDEVRRMCEDNTCGRYDNAWNCPPACGSVTELEAACRKYKYGILLNIVKDLEDSYDWEGMMEGGRRLYGLLAGAKGQADSFGMRDYRVFGSGRCYGCEECSFPGEPCRNPDMLFTPIEACGINVMAVAKKAGFNYINGQNTVTFFGMVLFNELDEV